MQNIKKLLSLFTRNELNSGGLLLIMIIIMALLDVIGVASILPFMAVLTKPSLIETNTILNALFEASSIFGVKSNQDFFFALGALFFLLLVSTLIFKAFTTYLQVRFVQMREFSIAKRLIEGYLHQPYSWFLNHNSADLGKTVLSEVQQIIVKGLSPLIDLIANSIIIIFLIILLLVVDPKLTLIVSFSLGIAYLLISFFLQAYLSQIGRERLKNNQIRFMAVNEAFNATKEIKIGNSEKYFIKIFSDSAKKYAQTQIYSGAVAKLPRFILEAIAFGGILLIILYLIWQSGSFNNSLPIISLYVLAGYRLMPAIQKVYASFTQLLFIAPSIDKLYDEIKALKPSDKSKNHKALTFNKSIILKDIFYSYPNSSISVLRGINLKIPSKSKVAFVGTTGSGKTTIIDIILGLLDVQKGFLEIDGELITSKNLRSWQRLIGYVPQDIYLSDGTIADNIAFGVNSENIDLERVKKVSKIANLNDFVVSELPKKYETSIGERGVRLSGGQRQRIGIARALYHDPKVLILDEATSALDNITEKTVIDNINNHSKDITVIIIAHRLTTIKECDTIFLLDKGQLKDKGTYDQLVQKNDQFKKSVKKV